MKKLPTIALVGRPNVGKSRLFNRLAGRRIAIVHDQAGVTRDVNALEVNHHYTLLDTGGIGLVVDLDHQQLIKAAEDQVWLAVEAADYILFVVDGREGLTVLDETIAERLRDSGKPVSLIVNKIDHEGMLGSAEAFETLGFQTSFALSAEHGFGSRLLEEWIEEQIGPPPPKESSDAMERIKLAFVGRPNVGKSSIINALLEDNRLVVSEVPGTTRDSVALDLDLESSEGRSLPFRLMDTAGLRRRKRVNHSIEYFSSVRSRDAIESADTVFIVIDAIEGVTRQDKALAGEIIEAGKCVCVLVNKWDLAIDQFRAQPPAGFTKMDDFRRAYAEKALEELFFLPDSPVIFLSAKTGLSLERIFKTARRLWELSGRTLSTPRLNQTFQKLIEKREPRYLKGKRFKLYYAVQIGKRPFEFRLFCNRATKLEDGYKRYLERGVMKAFGLTGCPIRFDLRGKQVRFKDEKKGSRK